MDESPEPSPAADSGNFTKKISKISENQYFKKFSFFQKTF